jgi:hypothetical protein
MRSRARHMVSTSWGRNGDAIRSEKRLLEQRVSISMSLEAGSIAAVHVSRGRPGGAVELRQSLSALPDR